MAEEGPMAQISLAGSEGALKGEGVGWGREEQGEEEGGEVRSTRTEAGGLLNRGMRRGLLCHVCVEEEVCVTSLRRQQKTCVCVRVLLCVCPTLCVGFMTSDLRSVCVYIL